jgi:hypothetical protein
MDIVDAYGVYSGVYADRDSRSRPTKPIVG